MFYLLLFSKLFLGFFGIIFDKIDFVLKKIYDFIKNKVKKLKIKKKTPNIQQEI